MRKVLKVSIVLWLATLLCSCASVSVVDTWRNPELRPQRLHKILVVSINNKESARRVYEDMLASELSRKGVEAVPGYSVIPGAAFADWGVLDRAVRRAQAQAILTVQTIKVEKQTTVHSDNPYPGYWYPQAFPGWDFPGYYRSMALYGPTYVTTYDVATMQVNLFDAASDKLIWAATMESTDPNRVTTVGQDLARKVVKKLAKEGLI
jgi:hypothetical protein